MTAYNRMNDFNKQSREYWENKRGQAREGYMRKITLTCVFCLTLISFLAVNLLAISKSSAPRKFMAGAAPLVTRQPDNPADALRHLIGKSKTKNPAAQQQTAAQKRRKTKF